MAAGSDPSAPPPRAVVLGDLVLDIVLSASGPVRRGTDVAGRVVLRQGGSAASTARVLAREGARSVLITATGGDRAASGLARYLGERGVEVHAVEVPSARPGRLGVIVEEGGERSFVADRGPILQLRAGQLRAAWFRDARLLHLPVYSLLGARLAATAERAARLARRHGARISIDLASAGFVRDFGAAEVLDTIARIGPDLLIANAQERDEILAAETRELTAFAPLVVIKEGALGARLRARGMGTELRLPRPARRVADTTGAGDAFDGGFLAEWLRAGAPTGGPGLRRILAGALRAGHRAAGRELREPRTEFAISGLVETNPSR